MSWLADFNEIFSMRLFHLRGLAQKNGEKVFALSTFEFSLSISLSLTHTHESPSHIHRQAHARTQSFFIQQQTLFLFVTDI